MITVGSMQFNAVETTLVDCMRSVGELDQNKLMVNSTIQ